MCWHRRDRIHGDDSTSGHIRNHARPAWWAGVTRSPSDGKETGGRQVSLWTSRHSESPVAVIPCTLIAHRRKTCRQRLAISDPPVACETELKAVLRGMKSWQFVDFWQCEPALDALRICQKQTDSLR